MPTTVAGQIRLTISPEVQAFAQERGLAPYMPALVEIVERIFAEATRMTVEVHEDPEEAGLTTINFDVEVPWPTWELTHMATKKWFEEAILVCPRQLLTDVNVIVWRRPA